MSDNKYSSDDRRTKDESFRVGRVVKGLFTNTAAYMFGDVGQAYDDFFGEHGYRRPSDYQAELDDLLSKHSDRFRRVPLSPQTLQGRTIQAYRVRHPHLREPAPRVLVTSLLHAREFITGETAMAFLHDCLADQGEAGRLARRAVIDVVPIVNPDGVNLNMKRMRGVWQRFGPLWRGNGRGVDLNRNFGADYSNRHRTYRWKVSDEFSGRWSVLRT